MGKIDKFHFMIAAIVLGVFGLIFYLVQSNVSSKDAAKSDASSILPSIFPSPTTFLSLDQIQNAEKSQQQAPPQQQQMQQQQVQAPEVAGVEDEPRASYSATLRTSKGVIKLTLDSKDAPKTVQNFITKAKSGFYNNLIFHRVEDWVIQGGDPKGDGTGGGQMPTELNQLPFTAGSLGVARGSNIQISNDAQFFITKQDASWLNGQYTNFGQVTDGMDVVNKIQVGDKILGITIE